MKYSIKVLRAINGSIRKWEKIAFEGGVDRGVANCSLCDEFYERQSCPECPLTSADLRCERFGSPYGEWNRGRGFDQFVRNENTQNASIQMLMALYHVREWYKLTAERG